MHRHLRRDLRRLALAGVLALGAFTTACSDDDGGDEDAKSSVEAGDEAWCEASRANVNATSAQALSTFEEAAEAAPAELEAEYAALLEYLEFTTENPGDAVAIEERKQEIVAPLLTVTGALQERCGITVNLVAPQ